MECLHYFLGFLLLAARMPLDAAKRFHDVLGNERPPPYTREHNQLNDWSSDENDWNEKLYPVWKRGDIRWKNTWKGGRVQAVLTSDSPALVGSNITFVVNLVFPRCQKEDADGNIVYEKNCRNGKNTRTLTLGNGTGQKTDVTLGPQLMEVAVYRRHRRAYVPIAQVKDVYVVTDQIPVFVTMSQKNDRNSSDETFLKDLPIMFDVLIHDPSHFLNYSTINYKWSFGDNTGLFVSMNNTVNHTYVLNGTFSLNLTVKAAAPGPCPPPPPRPPKPTPSLATTLKSYDSNTPRSAGDNPLELSKIPDEDCQVNRYGHFHATITIVEGILEVNIIKMTDILMRVPRPDNSLIDFVVTCQGSLPTEVCTVISDPTCEVTQNTVCDAVDVDETCLLTVRRAFNGSGTYCVNLTLGDDTSLALTSTLISVPDRDPASPVRMANSALISVGCLAVFVTVISLLVYKKHKEYKPIENSPGNVVRSKGLSVFFNRAKAVFFRGSQEKDPLLKNQEFKGVS
uniref:Transmembrane glycoprotein NMB n=1 Tax=Aotus nancymaae TaxID=37293 RepID=A0A2K5F495_AOTNA